MLELECARSLRPFPKSLVLRNRAGENQRFIEERQRQTIMKTVTLEQDEVKTTVRERYGKIASGAGGCGCAPTCCGPMGVAAAPSHDPKVISQGLGYSAADADAVPAAANLGLGCGNPQAIAALKPGETVLDLGSGAGFDAFLAARAVGSKGSVIGVDMTPEMVSKARKNQAAGGFTNVEFRIGEIESLPVADSTADVIISNCVINLSPDKPRVFRESFRVLKPGGRLAISDVVALAEIPAELRKDWELYTGCVAGASSLAEIKSWLAEAGFTGIRVEPKAGSRKIIGGWFPGRRLEEFVASATIEAVKPT
jgi:SAM-dependent methyltransferase